MNVITMHTNSPKNVYGGAYRRYMELINGVLLEGWKVYHISPNGFSSIQHENLLHYGTNKISVIPSFVGFLVQAIPKAYSIGRENKIDAVITFSFFDALIGIIFKVFNKNSKVVYCDRGDTIEGIIIDLKKKYNNKLLTALTLKLLNNFEKFIYKRLDLIIFNSNVRREEINRKFTVNSNKIKTIYNNANPSWVIKKIGIANIESQEIKSRFKDKKILSFIGNLYIDGRDLETLLKSFKDVNKAIPDTILFIVGDGPDKERLIEIQKLLGLDDVVYFEGWKENPFSYMLASDINLVTALHEGCSNTILESIYCENVMIGSNVGGIPRLLKHEELLFPPKNPDIMSKKIINLLESKKELLKAKGLIRKRKEKFVFDWNKEMVTVIKDII